MFLGLDLRLRATIYVDQGFSMKTQGKIMRESGEIGGNEPNEVISAYILRSHSDGLREGPNACTFESYACQWVSGWVGNMNLLLSILIGIRTGIEWKPTDLSFYNGVRMDCRHEPIVSNILIGVRIVVRTLYSECPSEYIFASKLNPKLFSKRFLGIFLTFY